MRIWAEAGADSAKSAHSAKRSCMECGTSWRESWVRRV
jgi:hypothetical protein